MSLYGPIEVSGSSQAHLGDVHHHHYSVKYGDEWQECLRALLLVDPRETKDSLKSRKGSRVNGTCEWFLSSDDFTLWLKSSAPSTRILWLYGNPGTGKSTLSMFLVEALEEQFSQRNDSTLAYFFCDGTSKHQNSVTAILRGLLFQLCMRQPAILAGVLLPDFRAKGSKLFDSFPALWHVFDTALKTIREDVFIFVDALDECDQASQELFLQQLELHNSHARLFITSRPSPGIREVLEEFACRDLSSFKQIKTDIGLFISEKVSRLATKKRYTPLLRNEVTDLLTSRAEGTFLWVGLACAEMQRLSAKSGLNLLKSLPSGLNLIYNKLFERAISDAIEAEDHANDITTILKSVAVAMVPLTTAQLSSACSLYQDELESERDLFTREKIDACRFMVVVEDKYVRLLHKSVKDFLFGSMTDHFPSLLGAHAELAHRCVGHLIQSFQNVQPPTFSMSCDEFYQYSARNWAHHARCAQQEYLVPADQQLFFEHTSTCRDDWLSYLLATGEDIALRFSLLDVAARWGITSLLDYAVSSIADSLSLMQFKDDVEHEYSNPLLSAAGCPYVHVFTYLLNLRAVEIDGKLQIIECLDTRIQTAIVYRLPVTTDVMAAVCRNALIGVQLVMSLIAERNEEVVLDDMILKAIMSNESCGTQILRILFKNDNPQITPISGYIDRAVAQGTVELEVLDLLREHDKENVYVNNTKIGSILAVSDAERVQRILKDRLQVTRISTELTMKAIQNQIHHNEVFMALLTHVRRPVKVSPNSMSLIAEHLDCRVFAKVADVTDDFSITVILENAAANQRYGDEVVTMILNEHPESTISEAVLLSAAQNLTMGGKILRLLLDFSPALKVTASVMIAALDMVRMSEKYRSYWMTEDVSPCVDDLATRIAILSSRFDDSEAFPEDALYELLIYHHANDGLILHSPAFEVVDLILRRHKLTLPDGFVQLFGRVGISDEKLTAYLEKIPFPCSDALLELIVRYLGIKALNYILDHYTSCIEPSVLWRLNNLACNGLSATIVLNALDGHEPRLTERSTTIKDLYYLGDNHQGAPLGHLNMLLWSTALRSDDNDQDLQRLLDLGADPNHRHQDMTVLQRTIERNNFHRARTLLRAGADIDMMPGRGTITMSRLICEKGRAASRLIQLMVKYGISVNLESTSHETPLVAAISQGAEKIVTILIRAGADVNARSGGKDDCALIALANTRSFDHQSHSRVLQTLLQASARTSPELHEKLIQRAVRVSNCEEIWLLARNTTWLASRKEVYPVFGSKSCDYSSDTLCLLSRLGVDLKPLMYWDETLVLMAVQEGYIGMVSWLSSMSQDSLCHGKIPVSSEVLRVDLTTLTQHSRRVDLQVRNNRGETLVHLAATGGQLGIMQWLLGKCKYDADVLDVQDACGRTALHKALLQKHYKIAAILAKHGANMDILDGAGYSARDWIAVAARSHPLITSIRRVEPHKVAEIKRLQSVGFEIDLQRQRLRAQGTVDTHRLGHLLHMSGHHDEAARAYEEGIELGSDLVIHVGVQCDSCKQSPICGMRYVCHLCDDCDVCEPCWGRRHLNIHPCYEQHKSDFLPIPREG